jgi:hypothetical protein
LLGASAPNGISERAVLVKCCLAIGEAISGRQAGLFPLLA